MQEINELKNLVVQSLETNGVLSQLRAQIRSSVFKVVEQQEAQARKPSSFYWENPHCQKIHQTPNGQECLDIIMEFLQFYKMDYTISVFQHEGNFKGEVNREQVSKNLGIRGDSSKPLLMQLLENGLSGSQVEQNQDRNRQQQLAQKTQNQQQVIGSSGVVQQNLQSQNLSQVQTENLSVTLGSQQSMPKSNQTTQQQFNKASLLQNSDKLQNLQSSQQNESNWGESQVDLHQTINLEQQSQLQNQDEQVRVSNLSNEDDQGIEHIHLDQQQQQLQQQTSGGAKKQNNNFMSNNSNKQVFESADNKSSNFNDSQGFDISNEKEKQTLLETKGKLQEIKENLKTGTLGEISQHNKESQQQQQIYQSQDKDEYDQDFEQFDENEQIDELIQDDENQDDAYGQSMEDNNKDQNNHQQGNGQFTQSEEYLGASQSQGFDMSVDSVALEEYDYFEDVDQVDYE